ncbi:OmpW/AlkL family protein [Coralloluteibacterium thermophilus]|uniref:OmpW family protein n=1 Tax=Coralloluteibacterium thermophilum TaxID=2707049 RepID=A0ABV9NLA8_9GAMM
MRTSKLLALAIGGAVFATPVAFAQNQTGNSMWAYGTSTGHSFNVVGSFAHMDTKSNTGTFAGGAGRVDGANTGTLSLSWLYNDAFGIELWGAVDKFSHDATYNGVKAATLDSQPLGLSVQFGHNFNDTFRPFIGLGYHETNYSNERGVGPLEGTRVGVTTAKGAMGTIGVDLLAGETWFVRTDARYLHSRPSLRLEGTGVGEARLDPWVYSVGIGARF